MVRFSCREDKRFQYTSKSKDVFYGNEPVQEFGNMVRSPSLIVLGEELWGRENLNKSIVGKGGFEGLILIGESSQVPFLFLDIGVHVEVANDNHGGFGILLSEPFQEKKEVELETRRLRPINIKKMDSSVGSNNMGKSRDGVGSRG